VVLNIFFLDRALALALGKSHIKSAGGSYSDQERKLNRPYFARQLSVMEKG